MFFRLNLLANSDSGLIQQVLTPTPERALRETLVPTPIPIRVQTRPRAALQTPTPSPHLTIRPTSNPTPWLYFGPSPVPPLLQIPISQHQGPTTTGSTPFMRPSVPQGPRSRRGPTHHHNQKRKKAQEVEVVHYRCSLCQVGCSSELNLRMHFMGHKHKAKLKVVKNNIVSGGISQQQAPKQQKYCELCRIWCTNGSSFRLHLDGKNHILKLHAA